LTHVGLSATGNRSDVPRRAPSPAGPNSPPDAAPAFEATRQRRRLRRVIRPPGVRGVVRKGLRGLSAPRSLPLLVFPRPGRGARGGNAGVVDGESVIGHPDAIGHLASNSLRTQSGTSRSPQTRRGPPFITGRAAGTGNAASRIGGAAQPPSSSESQRSDNCRALEIHNAGIPGLLIRRQRYRSQHCPNEVLGAELAKTVRR
jgi:hypothetical protein